MEAFPQQTREQRCYAPGVHSQSICAQATNPQAPNPQAAYPQGYFPDANFTYHGTNLQANFIQAGSPPAFYSQGTNLQEPLPTPGYPTVDNFVLGPLPGSFTAGSVPGSFPAPGAFTTGFGPSDGPLAYQQPFSQQPQAQQEPLGYHQPQAQQQQLGYYQPQGQQQQLGYQQPQAQQEPLGYHQPQAQQEPPAYQQPPPAYQQPQVQQELPAYQQQPEEPKLTFEERIARFLPVPEYSQDPNPKRGPGRKKKPQRFWPPPNATNYVRAKFEQLQRADEDVTKAEEKLAKNDKPHKTEHFQNILERNMQKRENLWTQCVRVQLGKVAIERDLPEAEIHWKKDLDKWQEQDAREQQKITELRTKYPEFAQADISIDPTRLSKKDRESLNSTENWTKHDLLDLHDSFLCLQDAYDRKFGKIHVKAHLHARASRMHELGFYDTWCEFQWPGDSPLHAALRQEFSNPDPLTWGTEGPTSDQDPNYQAQVYQHPQPEVNYGPGEPAVFDAQQNQDQVGDDQVAFQEAGAVTWEAPHANPEVNAGPIDPALTPQQQPDQQLAQLPEDPLNDNQAYLERIQWVVGSLTDARPIFNELFRE